VKRKVVLDTNVFVSILKKGRLRRILNLWLDEKFDLVTSDEIIKELFDVLKRPKFNFSLDEIEELGDLLFEKALVYNPQIKLNVCTDANDNKFVECAVEGKADCIISGDPHLLELKEYRGIKILSPAEFILQYKYKF